jgi:sialate O-acetylesterase
MKAFTDDASKLGIPVQTAGIHFQCRVQDLVVSSNVEGITTGAIGEGSIEFWPNNYGGGNNAQVPGAVGSIYDFGDSPNEVVSGYGSMQLHDFQHKGTIFAYNSFCSGTNADFGLGTSVGPHKDWTFTNGLKKYDSVKMVIMVR